jgi:hypothetical protein
MRYERPNHAAANGGIALLFQSPRLFAAVAGLGRQADEHHSHIDYEQ